MFGKDINNEDQPKNPFSDENIRQIKEQTERLMRGMEEGNDEPMNIGEILRRAMEDGQGPTKEQKQEVIDAIVASETKDTLLRLMMRNKGAEARELLNRTAEIKMRLWDDKDILPKQVRVHCSQKRRNSTDDLGWQTINCEVVAYDCWSIQYPYQVKYPNGEQDWVSGND